MFHLLMVAMTGPTSYASIFSLLMGSFYFMFSVDELNLKSKSRKGVGFIIEFIKNAQHKTRTKRN